MPPPAEAAKAARPRERRAFGVRLKDGTGKARMVEAFSAASALRHVAESLYEAKPLSLKEAVQLARDGIESEVAGESPADAE